MDFSQTETTSVDDPLAALVKEAQALASQVGGLIHRKVVLEQYMLCSITTQKKLQNGFIPWS